MFKEGDKVRLVDNSVYDLTMMEVVHVDNYSVTVKFLRSTHHKDDIFKITPEPFYKDKVMMLKSTPESFVYWDDFKDGE